MMSSNAIVSGSVPVSSVDNKVDFLASVDEVERCFTEARKCNIAAGLPLVVATLNAAAVVWRNVVNGACRVVGEEEAEELRSFVVDLVICAFAMGEGMPFNTAEVAAKRFLERLNGKDYDEVVYKAYTRTRKEFGAVIVTPTPKPVETAKPAYQPPPKLTEAKVQTSFDIALRRGRNEAADTVEDLVCMISRDKRHTDEERSALFVMCVELYASLLPTEGAESAVTANKWFANVVPMAHKTVVANNAQVQPQAVRTPAPKPMFTVEKLKLSFGLATTPQKQVETLEAMIRMILEDDRYAESEREFLFAQIRSLYFLVLPPSAAKLVITQKWFEQQMPKAPQRKPAKFGQQHFVQPQSSTRVNLREPKSVSVATPPAPLTKEDHERLAAAARTARIEKKAEEARNRNDKDFGSTKQVVLSDKERSAAKAAKVAAKKAKKAAKGGR